MASHPGRLVLATFTDTSNGSSFALFCFDRQGTRSEHEWEIGPLFSIMIEEKPLKANDREQRLRQVCASCSVQLYKRK
eukprot:2459261-Amphidinium_carterae.2